MSATRILSISVNSRSQRTPTMIFDIIFQHCDASLFTSQCKDGKISLQFMSFIIRNLFLPANFLRLQSSIVSSNADSEGQLLELRLR
eukprot:scaffold11572_cov95-Skeletonema_dohrnii-CCMP3373.AAC.5